MCPPSADTSVKCERKAQYLHFVDSFNAGGFMLRWTSAATAYLVKAPFAAMSGTPWNTVAVSGCLTAGVTLAANHTTMRCSHVQKLTYTCWVVSHRMIHDGTAGASDMQVNAHPRS